MKCPFRKTVIERDKSTFEHFMECYGSDCPFYEPPKTFSGGITLMEGCARTYKEKNKDNEIL